MWDFWGLCWFCERLKLNSWKMFQTWMYGGKNKSPDIFQFLLFAYISSFDLIYKTIKKLIMFNHRKHQLIPLSSCLPPGNVWNRKFIQISKNLLNIWWKIKRPEYIQNIQTPKLIARWSPIQIDDFTFTKSHNLFTKNIPNHSTFHLSSCDVWSHLVCSVSPFLPADYPNLM